MATAAEHQAQIDRINGEVATQAAKIAQLSTILDGKAGGGGGALQVATGVFTPSNIILYSAPIRVSGLGFRPKYVFARCEISVPVTYFLGNYPCTMLGAIFGGDGDVPAIAAYLSASSQTATTAKMEFSNNDVYTIAFNDDGFEIKTTASSGKICANGQWTYYAVG